MVQVFLLGVLLGAVIGIVAVLIVRQKGGA